MATRTAQSGLWSDPTTWGGTVPVNGDAFNIPVGVVVKCDVDQSSMATGMAASVIDGLLHFDADTNTCLKMNGNITGTGALYICERATVTGWTLTTDKTYTYQVSRSLDVATVEDTLGDGYLDAVEELIEVAIDVENAARVAQSLNEMMPDAVQTFIETTKASLTLSQILAYVEITPGSFYHDTVNDLLYIHTSDSTDPAGKTITVIEPINRPASGSEYRCHNLWNSTGTIAMTGTPIIRAYGWYPEREWTQLSAGADLGATALPPLNHDLGLQQGDKISIASGNEFGQIAETSKGVYTVSSYDAETKIITLTSGLVKERLEGDYVCMASRSIKMGRASGTSAYITATINDIVLEGVYADTYIVQNSTDLTLFSSNLTAKHCISGNKALFSNVKNSLISNSMRIGGASSVLINGNYNDIEDCICISGVQIASGNLNRLNRCIQENTITTSGGIVKNSKFKNFQYISAIYEPIFINCEFSGQDIDTIVYNYINPARFINCVFKDNLTGYLKFFTGKLQNCLFEGETEINAYAFFGRLPHQVLESFDHNQLLGNYKAWMRGGKIETDLDGSTILPGRLILSCESADYPVFRDFPVLLPAYRTSTWQALTKKSFTGGSVKMELIDPANDPLIDPSAQPLASYSLLDIADTNFPLKLGYKSSVPMQAIIRISAQNSTGTVEIDTRLIENRVQHGQ